LQYIKDISKIKTNDQRDQKMTFKELKSKIKVTHPGISLSIIDKSNDSRFPVYHILVKINAYDEIAEVRIGRFDQHLTESELESISINPALFNLKNAIG